jgi:hypothetical protein
MRIGRFITITFLLLTAASTSHMSDSQKIRALLVAIERSNLIFIRNGVEHSAKEAREHLERKLSRAGSLIRTPEQFIEHIASKSSISGTPYYVKYPDGSTMRTSIWLRIKLREIEHGDR